MAEGKIKDVNIFKKLENIWFYYKWYILAAILLVAFVAIGVKQCCEVIKPDMGVIFVTEKGGNFTSTNAEEIGIFIEQNYLTDYNGDGQLYCNVTHIVLDMEYMDDSQAAQRQNLLINLGNNENFVIICDEESYEYLCKIEMSDGVETGVFEPIKNFIITENTEELRASLADTALGDMGTLKEKETPLFMGLRLYNKSGAENDEKATSLFEYSCEIADKIIKDKA